VRASAYVHSDNGRALSCVCAQVCKFMMRIHSLVFSVHSPQVTGSPFHVAPRSFSEGIDPRAMMNPARKINPDIMPVMSNFWVEKVLKSSRRVLNIECNARGETMQSNALGGFHFKREVKQMSDCGDKNVFSRRATACQYSPRTQNADVLTIPSPTSASKPGRPARDTRGSMRFSDDNHATQHGKPPRQHQQADTPFDEPEEIKFGSTAHHCGSYDPRVPPPMLGRVQPLVTWQVRRLRCMAQHVLEMHAQLWHV
jgi:hypothetical protein